MSPSNHKIGPGLATSVTERSIMKPRSGRLWWTQIWRNFSHHKHFMSPFHLRGWFCFCYTPWKCLVDGQITQGDRYEWEFDEKSLKQRAWFNHSSFKLTSGSIWSVDADKSFCPPTIRCNQRVVLDTIRLCTTHVFAQYSSSVTGGDHRVMLDMSQPSVTRGSGTMIAGVCVAILEDEHWDFIFHFQEYKIWCIRKMMIRMDRGAPSSLSASVYSVLIFDRTIWGWAMRLQIFQTHPTHPGFWH